MAVLFRNDPYPTFEKGIRSCRDRPFLIPCEAVSKQQWWLALVGLMAGVALAYLQIRPCARPKTRPSATRAGATADSRARRLCLPPARPTAATTSARRATPAFQPAASFRSPDIFVAGPIAKVPRTLSDMWPADKPAGIRLPLPDDGRLWSSRFDVRRSDADGGGGILDFMPKKAEGEPVGTIDVSNTADIGAACRLIESEDTKLRGRFGGGFSQDYTGLAEGQRIPEVLMGVQVEHQMSERNKILGGVEYARDVTDFGRYRVRSQAAWEVLLDPDKNLSLRTGVLESSDTAPNGEHGKCLDYSLDVTWKY